MRRRVYDIYAATHLWNLEGNLCGCATWISQLRRFPRKGNKIESNRSVYAPLILTLVSPVTLSTKQPTWFPSESKLFIIQSDQLQYSFLERE